MQRCHEKRQRCTGEQYKRRLRASWRRAAQKCCYVRAPVRQAPRPPVSPSLILESRPSHPVVRVSENLGACMHRQPFVCASLKCSSPGRRSCAATLPLSCLVFRSLVLVQARRKKGRSLEVGRSVRGHRAKRSEKDCRKFGKRRGRAEKEEEEEEEEK